MHPDRSLLLAFTLVTCAACGDPVDVGNFGGAGGDAGITDSSTGGAAGAAGSGGSSGGGGTAGAPNPVGTGTGKIAIHFQSTTAPFAHNDGLSGQTPISHLSGVRSLELRRTLDDPSPVTVFDFGQKTVEISYANGADTLIYTADIKYLPKATYTIARVVHTYVRYQIASTMHEGGMNLPGTFDNVQVLSDGTLLDGTVRNHGYFEFLFKTGGQSFPSTGTNAPLPEWTGVGGFPVIFEKGQWAYQFPTNLVVDPDSNADFTLTFLSNMNESYRWADQDAPGYGKGVFDSTSTSFEPVKQFGANSFEIQFK